MTQTIGLSMFVKDEENCVIGAIESVLPIVSEIHVIDTGSTDKTNDLLSDYPDSHDLKAHYWLYSFPFPDDFGKMRTIASRLPTTDWVLMLDADERIERKDLELIKKLVEDTEAEAWFLPRKRWADIEMKKQVEVNAYPDWQMRLFRRNDRHTFKRQVHEYYDGGPGCCIKYADNGPHINHFCDVFHKGERWTQRQEQYKDLAKTAKVKPEGGQELHD